MALSTVLQRSLLACLSLFVFNFSTNAQNLASDDVFVPTFGKGMSKKDRGVSVHVTPSKYFCGELPLTVAKQISNALVVEVGGGPAFRDRVAEKLFTGDVLQELPFINSAATVNSGFAIQAGVRWLTSGDALQGFYLNPELAYAARSINFPALLNGRAYTYEGKVTSMDLRLLLGYDRLVSSYSEHLYYGGFLGFGMRRYEADYFVIGKNDPGTRSAVEAIPTLHLGYRLGWKF